ncbi:helix-turn-helix domain-containing protein [uncultured Tateyamaria sp.]|uniref:GlxA family transcriptional regulator n=1 Tax=uncultured Tateyamaria sp. TaxID=455651 RepID=UPI0026191C7C|nr:helix-turn-helix domain-containing protein [uncultured Tateyamaria sp.]
MPDSPKSQAAPQQFDILLFDQFSNHCLANTVEPLRAANTLSQRTLYTWRFCTMDGQTVRSSSGMEVTPHGALGDTWGGSLVVMPSYGVRALDHGDVIRPLARALKRYDTLIGMDTGSWLLARAGALNGRRATIHWDVLDSFAEAFPDIDTVRNRFVVDGARLTCSGAMAAFDLVAHLISEHHGPLLALEVGQLFMSPEATSRPLNTPIRAGRTVTRAIAIMQAHLDQPIAISTLAHSLGCTQKTLEARVRDAMQMTPQALYRRLRLNHALALLQDTDQPISEIAGRCGYETPSALSRAFRATFDQTPSAVRGAA